MNILFYIIATGKKIIVPKGLKNKPTMLETFHFNIFLHFLKNCSRSYLFDKDYITNFQKLLKEYTNKLSNRLITIPNMI